MVKRSDESLQTYMLRLQEAIKSSRTGAVTFADEKEIIHHFCKSLGQDFHNRAAREVYAEVSNQSISAAGFATLFSEKIKLHTLKEDPTNMNSMTIQQFNALKRARDETEQGEVPHGHNCSTPDCRACGNTIKMAMVCGRCCMGNHQPRRCKNKIFRPDIRCPRCSELVIPGKEHNCYFDDNTFCLRCSQRGHNDVACKQSEPTYRSKFTANTSTTNNKLRKVVVIDKPVATSSNTSTGANNTPVPMSH
jgi:hypothetical protein